MARTPSLFIAHGSPMNAIEHNVFTEDWYKIAKVEEKPAAIVVFSAHWQTDITQITASKNPRTMHDFSGFPDRLYQMTYPCPGDPNTAALLMQHLHSSGFEAEMDTSRGLDHGSWSFLQHLFPAADIPILQVSLSNRLEGLMSHYELAKSLRPLREQNILFVGSGNIVHNIPLWLSMTAESSFEWAETFNHAVTEAIKLGDIDKLCNPSRLPFYHLAVPTIEHYLPLIYSLGLAYKEESRDHSIFSDHSIATVSSYSWRFS